MYLLQRMKECDVVFLTTDDVVDNRKKHVNRATIRTSMDTFWPLTVPVLNLGATTECRVSNAYEWRKRIRHDVKRGYHSLPYQEKAIEIVEEVLNWNKSEWLVDYLSQAFLLSVQALKFDNKVFQPVPPETHRMFETESELLMWLCTEHDCDRLLVGRTQFYDLNRRMLGNGGIDTDMHEWWGGMSIVNRDSVLDTIARFKPEEVQAML